MKTLFHDQMPFFASVTRVRWTFDPEVDGWIDTIESLDPRSTFFRYPNPSERESDTSKAVMADARPQEIFECVTSDPETMQFILLLENKDGEVTRGYYHGGPAPAEFSPVLKDWSGFLYGMHAALRAEVCGGA